MPSVRSLTLLEAQGQLGDRACRWRGVILFALGMCVWSEVFFASAESPRFHSAARAFSRAHAQGGMLLNDGVWTQAEFAGWDRQGLRFDTEEESGVFEAGGFIMWGQLSVLPWQALILLSDGSVLTGEVLSWDATEVVLESRLWGRLTLPRNSVRGGLFRPLAGAKGRIRQANMLSEARQLDRIWLEGGDWLEVEEVKLTRGADRSLVIDTRLRESEPMMLRVPVERVWGISQGRPKEGAVAAAGNTVWKWVFDDGSLLCVRSWERVEGKLEIELGAGVRLRSMPVTEAELGSRLRGVWTMPEGAVDLLTTEAVQEGQVSWIGQGWTARQHQRPEGDGLQISGRVYPSGLGVVGGSTQVYSLPAGAQRLRFWVGLDDRSPVPSAKVKVFVADRAGEWSTKAIWGADLVRGDQPSGGEVQIDGGGTLRVAINVQAPAQVGPSPLVDWLELLSVPGEKQ